MNNKITKKEKNIINDKIPPVKIALITANNMCDSKKQKIAWTAPLLKSAKQYTKNTDVLPHIEEQLRTTKKHDIIDVGHRNTEAMETIEALLSDGNNKRLDQDLAELAELQLEEVRANEAVEVLTEGELKSKWDESTWRGDDIKIYRDINARQKMDAEANETFYANHPELTRGGKGMVGA